MIEKKYLKKIRNLLRQVNINLHQSKNKSYIESIRFNYIYWSGVKEKNGNTGYKYDKSTIFIDLYNIITQYKISEQTIEKIYSEEKLKDTKTKNKDKQEPIIRRDNKGVYIGSSGSNISKIRYPKKNRQLSVWKKFYNMFPYRAKLDNWDGKTSDKMN